MRSRSRHDVLATVLALATLWAGTPLRSLAADGVLKVTVREAIAHTKGQDDSGKWAPQDFYAVHSIDNGPPVVAPEISDRDYAVWNPASVNTKFVPGRNQRFFDLYFELWDKDNCCFGNVDDQMDISPQNGLPPLPPNPAPIYHPSVPDPSAPHVTYDVCTGRMYVLGVGMQPPTPIGSNQAELNGVNSSPGYYKNWAALRFTVTPEPPNWLPEDIRVSEVQIVQAIYDQARAVADKDTILRVIVDSTYPFTIPNAPLIGEMTDGINTVQDARIVTIEPGNNIYYLFERPRATPFRPYKPSVIPGPGTGVVRAWARVDYNETISPNAPVQLMDCANINNTCNATDLPLVKVTDPYTVFAPFDYSENLTFLTSQQLQGLYARDEPLRLASWPLAALNSAKSFNQLSRDHGSDILCPFEPFCTVIKYSNGAAQAGIDRLVLSVRHDWFVENAFRHQWIPSTAIGYSLGWFARHAVLAEDGFYGVSTHELGHTYDLSQRACSNGGLFGTCADEYAHPNIPDGSPYRAVGFDVNGEVYPNGIHATTWRGYGLGCPATLPILNDVCTANIMDDNLPNRHGNWSDSPTFHWLMDFLPHIDPFVITVSGLIHLPDGFGDGTVPPEMEGLMPFFSYQHMGSQDMDEAPLSEMGETFSGFGAFWIRFVTPAGVRDYRFNPRFFDNAPLPDAAGAFSLNLPWDPSTTAIQLIGLADLNVDGCQNTLCLGGDVVLAERLVSHAPPMVTDLRAGKDVPAPPTPPGGTPAVPVIGPGHELVLSWDSGDPDSPELRSTLILVLRSAAGGPAGAPSPMAIDISGNSFTIPHARLAGGPGDYEVRLQVSDGVNTVEAQPGPIQLFTICNLSNGGVEACNGIDDDCDGVVDNAANPGPIQSVALNPQPFPPGPTGGGPVLSWGAHPLAQSYDVVYGRLDELADPAGFASATSGCLAQGFQGTALEVRPQPKGPGEGYWFLVRGRNCAGPGTYDSGSPSQVGSRDAGIAASPVACP